MQSGCREKAFLLPVSRMSCTSWTLIAIFWLRLSLLAQLPSTIDGRPKATAIRGTETILF